MQRWVVDVGNTRVKWARVGPNGTLEPAQAVGVDGLNGSAPIAAELRSKEPSIWAFASVNPPILDWLLPILDGPAAIRSVYRSAADVDVPNVLESPASTGVDRALSALGGSRRRGGRGPGLVISCGTALTVDYIASDGVWQGGAIAAGLGLAADALARATAQLPHVLPRAVAPPRGRSTMPAISAGVFWGAIGALRELVRQQGAVSWTIWTGGDAALLAPYVVEAEPVVIPDLVLEELARVAFPDRYAEQVDA